MTRQTSATRPSWVDDDLFPFESRFVEVEGNTVHYVDEGSGPTLLLLHGNPTWSFVYRQTIIALRDRFRCVALDYPGFGLSTAAPSYGYLPEEHAAIVSEFIERLDLQGVTIVVQDWGGPIGISAAARARPRIHALVIGNTWAWPVNGDFHFESFSRLMGGPLGRVLIERLNLFVNVMVPAGHRRRRPTAAEMHHYRQALPSARRRRASAIFPRAITASRQFLGRVEGELSGLTQLPVLFLWGDADFAFRKKELARWQERFPGRETVVLAGAGHYLQSDAPEDFAAAIRSWFDALPGEPSPNPAVGRPT